MPRTRPAMTGALPCLRRRFATSLPPGCRGDRADGHVAGAQGLPAPARARHRRLLLAADPLLRRRLLGGDPRDHLPAAAGPLRAPLRHGVDPRRRPHHARLHRHRHHPDGGDPRGAGERGGAAGAEHPERRLRHLDAGPRRPGDAAGLGAAPARALRHRRGSRGDARPLHRRPAADRPAPRHPGADPRAEHPALHRLDGHHALRAVLPVPRRPRHRPHASATRCR